MWWRSPPQWCPPHDYALGVTDSGFKFEMPSGSGRPAPVLCFSVAIATVSDDQFHPFVEVAPVGVRERRLDDRI